MSIEDSVAELEREVEALEKENDDLEEENDQLRDERDKALKARADMKALTFGARMSAAMNAWPLFIHDEFIQDEFVAVDYAGLEARALMNTWKKVAPTDPRISLFDIKTANYKFGVDVVSYPSAATFTVDAPLPEEWTCGDGRAVKIKGMADSHLYFAIAKYYRGDYPSDSGKKERERDHACKALKAEAARRLGATCGPLGPVLEVTKKERDQAIRERDYEKDRRQEQGITNARLAIDLTTRDLEIAKLKANLAHERQAAENACAEAMRLRRANDIQAETIYMLDARVQDLREHNVRLEQQKAAAASVETRYGVFHEKAGKVTRSDIYPGQYLFQDALNHKDHCQRVNREMRYFIQAL